MNVNGRAAWHFNDENGLYAEIIDNRHAYDEIRPAFEAAQEFLRP